MPDPLKSRFTDDAHQAHVETVGERMRDTTELDNLKADVRQSAGKEITMPWRTGRPLRSSGMDPKTGLPATPMASLDSNRLTPRELDSLGRDFDRALIADSISEGTLDRAEAMGVPLEVTPQWFEDEQTKADEAAAAASLHTYKRPGIPPVKGEL